MSKRIAVLLCFDVGAVGAAGQALLLRHELVDKYPYKILDPYSLVYDKIGNTGVLVAPIVAIVVMFGCFWVKQWLLPAIPVLLCPLVFLAVFEYSWLYTRVDPNYVGLPAEGYTLDSARWLFTQTALSLALEGLVIGIGCGILITVGERWISKRGAYGQFP